MAKNPEIDIYKSLRRNNTVVWAMTGAFVLGILIMAIMAFKMYKYNMNHMLTLDKNGEVLPLTMVERDENLKIEIKHHIEMFLTNFYEYDRYNWKKNVDRALWLADQSAEKLFLHRENQGWFNEVTNQGTSQRILFETDSIKVSGQKEPFAFEVPAMLIIENASQKNIYRFTSHGKIISVGRNYPLNPHGLLITNFQETGKKLIKQE